MSPTKKETWRIFPKGYARSMTLKQKRRLLFVGLLFGLLLIFSPSIRYRVFSFLSYPIHYKEYKHFGIRIPGDYTVHGIDVSRYQGQIDWQRVADMEVGDTRISFAFIKATEGSWIKDPQFTRNWKEAGKTRLYRGAYHYFLPNISPQHQANLFIRQVRLKPGDLPPMVDIEETRAMSVEQVRMYTLRFLKLLEAHYGVAPIVYTGLDFYRIHFAEQSEFDAYPFWLAHYHVPSLEVPDKRIFSFWQHSNKGTINGINEQVDFNVFNGSIESLERLRIQGR
ncbi:MAG: GH25 family lysozyme [Saprospiraceae bacterium]